MSDDHHWNDKRPERQRQARSMSEVLRESLREVGIELDDPKSAAPHPREPDRVEPVDRAEIRRILVELGAPASDIEWLVSSCPSIEHARGYRPPRGAP